MITIFQLDKDQEVKLTEWLNQHNPHCKYFHNHGAIGGRLNFIFTPTQLGLVTKVVCECGEKIDLTDYDMW